MKPKTKKTSKPKSNQKDSKVEKKSKKRLPKPPPILDYKYNVELNKYIKVTPKVTPKPDAKTTKDQKFKNDKDSGKPKKVSKSQKFWKEQSAKAEEKRGKHSEDFETVPIAQSDDEWDSGSELESDGHFEENIQSPSDLEESLFDQEKESMDFEENEMENRSEPDVQDVTTLDEKEEVLEPESALDDEDEDEEKDVAEKVKSQNRKGKKSGGFQSMGLSFPLFKAIQHQGYKVPTPIQRKVIPIIQQGGDVVAMARTGSGKTAAFLIPLIEKLKSHSAKVGARALLLSPARELATQTLKFANDLSKYTDLRSCAFVGGDNMDDQFSALASNPDIIIATPGRLMHLIIEAKLDLKSIEYLVFDEADRLFEMGFAEQLREIVLKLPASRQTLLFSATLPKILIDFARAGLVNPTLIRLDVDTKISRDLQMYFFSVKQEEKEGSLLYLLRNVIPTDQQTVIFVATKHHVEYIHQLLQQNGLSSTYIYGSLDQSARKVHLARFKYGKVKILVVTDVAARGIDVPLLDNVINYDFPSSSKVFVHRVGRTARAGKSGSSWSIVTNSEIPYMLDLQLFTGRPMVFASNFEDAEPDYTKELVFGYLPLNDITLEVESVATLIKGNIALETLRDSSKQGYKMYIRSRPTATKDSYSRAKEITEQSIGIHPLLRSKVTKKDVDHFEMIKSISNFRGESVFEVGKKGAKTPEALLMQKRRKKLANVILGSKKTFQESVANEKAKQLKVLEHRDLSDLDEEALQGFNVEGKTKKSIIDKEFYLDYRPADDNTETGYAVHAGEGASFYETAHKAALDIVADDETAMKKQNQLRWDSKKHKFIKDQVGSDNKKRIRTENGTLVQASFKSDRFERWSKRTRVELPKVGEMEITGASSMVPTGGRKYRHNSTTAPKLDSKNFARKLANQESVWRKEGLKGAQLREAKSAFLEGKNVVPKRQGKSELKTPHQIAKEREAKDKRRAKTGRHAHVMGKGKGGSKGKAKGKR